MKQGKKAVKIMSAKIVCFTLFNFQTFLHFDFSLYLCTPKAIKQKIIKKNKWQKTSRRLSQETSVKRR